MIAPLWIMLLSSATGSVLTSCGSTSSFIASFRTFCSATRRAAAALTWGALSRDITVPEVRLGMADTAALRQQPGRPGQRLEDGAALLGHAAGRDRAHADQLVADGPDQITPHARLQRDLGVREHVVIEQ